jgi:hypothetical protein
MQPGQPKSNAGTIAAVLGGIAAVGGIAAAAFAGSKKPTRLSGPRARPLVRKPCGCGR